MQPTTNVKGRTPSQAKCTNSTFCEVNLAKVPDAYSGYPIYSVLQNIWDDPNTRLHGTFGILYPWLAKMIGERTV